MLNAQHCRWHKAQSSVEVNFRAERSAQLGSKEHAQNLIPRENDWQNMSPYRMFSMLMLIHTIKAQTFPFIMSQLSPSIDADSKSKH